MDYYFTFAYDQRTTVNLFLTVAHVIIDRGVIFPSIEEYEYVTKVDIKTGTVNR